MKETLSFNSGTLAIHYDIYFNENLSYHKALIQIAHGMVEHRGKYAYIANKLMEMGYIVAINDHRGHGDSIGGEIYLGEMGENGFDMAVEDMHALSLILKERFKPRKFILIGHSMGSLLSRRFLQKHESSLDMLILCGSPSLNPLIPLGILVLKILRFFKINTIAQSLAHRLSFLSFNRKYDKFDTLDNGKKSGALWINRDIDELKKHISDKKCRFIFSVNSFINLLLGLKAVFSKYPNEIKKPNLPILFVSGEDDACGQFGKGVLNALKHIHNEGYQNAKMILYAGARHELFLELNKDEVISDIISWVESRL